MFVGWSTRKKGTTKSKKKTRVNYRPQMGQLRSLPPPPKKKKKDGRKLLKPKRPNDTEQPADRFAGVSRLGVLGLLWDHLPRGLLQQLRHGPGARVLPQHIASVVKSAKPC